MSNKKKTYTVKCPNCKNTFTINEDEILTSTNGEKFVSCRTIVSYSRFHIPRLCTGYISIPEDVVKEKIEDS